MKKKKLVIIFVMGIFLVTIALALILLYKNDLDNRTKASTPSSGVVIINLTPLSGSIGKSDKAINVNLDTAGTEISTVNLNITYDPAVLSVTVQIGTITQLNQLFASSVSNGVINIQAGALTYNGSGLLAVLQVKTLSTLSSIKNTALTISSDSMVTTPSDLTINQLASSVLGASSTYLATIINPTCMGYDFDNDGKVDINDFAIWRPCYQKRGLTTIADSKCDFADIRKDDWVNITDFAYLVVAITNYRTTADKSCIK